MSVTLELKPQIEQQVVEQSASRGVSVKYLSESLIEESFNRKEDQSSYQVLAEWEAALDEFVDSPAFARAIDCFVDYSREGIY